MNEHTHMHTVNFLSSPLLVDMQLDKRAFDKALGTHTLPFQSWFHNGKAQLHRPTLTKLYQTEPLIPLQHRESHPARPLKTISHFPRCHTVSNPNGSGPPPPPCHQIWFAHTQLNHILLLWSSWKMLWKSNPLFFCNRCKKSILESWAVWWLWLDSYSQMSSVKT